MKKIPNKKNQKFIVPFGKQIIFSKPNEISNLKNLKSTIKTAKNRKNSSTLWIQRQINDIYVKKAKIEGYFSRSAYKLLEINKKFDLIKPNYKVIDLGAAPGGWSQVASKLVGCNGQVISVDLLEIKLKALNTTIIKGDFLHKDTLEKINNALNGKANVILSDMSPNTTGSKELDHLRIINLIEMVINFTNQALINEGALVIKLFQGGLEKELFKSIQTKFKQVKYFKPNASRKESKEVYLIATHFY